MAKSQDTFNKKEAEKKRQKKKQDKVLKKEERKANAKDGNNLEEMMAYVDENGNISSTPPDPKRKIVKISQEDITLGVPKHDTVQVKKVRTGIVTFFNDSKGYGFIKDMDTQESVFVHINGLVDKIKENNKVTFEVEMGQKGPNAIEVKLSK